MTEPQRGVRCQGLAVRSGERCKTRAFAYVRVINGKSFRDVWLCGNHQRSETKAGKIVRLIMKWRQHAG